MDTSVPDCLVTGHEGLVESLKLPDPNDRHVLAAAIRCQADVIVTYNLADFPKDALDPYGISAQHPDEFVMHLLDLSPAAVCAAVRDQRLALSRPTRSVGDLLDTFLWRQALHWKYSNPARRNELFRLQPHAGQAKPEGQRESTSAASHFSSLP